VNRFPASGSRLIIYPGKRKIASVSVSGHKYDSSFINMYVNSAGKGYYLSDLNILNSSTVELNGINYNLPGDKITLELGNDFYDITALTLSASATTPALSLTNSVIARGSNLSNIAAIFVGTSTLNLSGISTLQFVIDGQIYNLSDLNIDASGNITISGNTYDCNKVAMLVNSATQYKINSIALTNGKLFFYCAETATNANMVLLDNKYRDASKVIIYKDGIAYDLDHVAIVSRNLLRIGGKQYSLDSTFKVNFDGNTYYIDEINYNSSLMVPVIKTSTKTAGIASPTSYNFYVNNTLYQNGANDQTSIYTSSRWVTFSSIAVSDPANFTYSGTTYALIGSLVKIGSTQYKITDTAWRGSSQILELYLKEI